MRQALTLVKHVILVTKLNRSHKDERLCINETAQNGMQLAKHMNDVSFKSLGFRAIVGYNKMAKDDPFVTLKCCRGVEQSTSRSNRKQTTSVLPHNDVKCSWCMTMRYDR